MVTYLSIIGRPVRVLYIHCIYNNTLYITIIVVFLTAFSIRVGLISSKVHNGDDTAKDTCFVLKYKMTGNTIVLQGGARNVIPLIVHVTHFYCYKSI